MKAEPAFATPANAHTYGEHRSPRSAARLAYVRGRVTAGLSGAHPAETGRYHLYAAWSCPWSHRAAIQIALNGLSDAVSVSYVHGQRDARGWAFRPDTGPDPIHGFQLLRDVYEASHPGYDGAVTVPVLWDRKTSRIVSNDPETIDRDLATAFRGIGEPGLDLYPAHLAARIDALASVIDNAIGRGLGRAVRDSVARDALLAAFHSLDRRLVTGRLLFGEVPTIADVRLWVNLVRYDAGANAYHSIGPRLASFPRLWEYARSLHAVPAFRATTRFAEFAAPLAPLPDWDGAVAPDGFADVGFVSATARAG